MNFFRSPLRHILGIAAIFILCAMVSPAQHTRGTLRGVIKDELGATIVGATVTLIDSNGVEKSATTNGEGAYVFSGLAPGKYFLRAAATGFAPSDETEVDLTARARESLDLTMKVTI
jgi:uncharacterized surface anchored protein